jgi:hypothetical protein
MGGYLFRLFLKMPLRGRAGAAQFIQYSYPRQMRREIGRSNCAEHAGNPGRFGEFRRVARPSATRESCGMLVDVRAD